MNSWKWSESTVVQCPPSAISNDTVHFPTIIANLKFKVEMIPLLNLLWPVTHDQPKYRMTEGQNDAREYQPAAKIYQVIFSSLSFTGRFNREEEEEEEDHKPIIEDEKKSDKEWNITES